MIIADVQMMNPTQENGPVWPDGFLAFNPFVGVLERHERYTSALRGTPSPCSEQRYNSIFGVQIIARTPFRIIDSVLHIQDKKCSSAIERQFMNRHQDPQLARARIGIREGNTFTACGRDDKLRAMPVRRPRISLCSSRLRSDSKERKDAG
jgi:hypothetical protein